jgi:fibronectin type 3 domain-containing protein
MRSVSRRVLALVGLMALLCAVGQAQVMKPSKTPLDTVAFKDFSLGVKSRPVALSDCLQSLPNKSAWAAFLRQNGQVEAHVDAYTGMPVLVNGTRLAWVNGDPFAAGQPASMALKARAFLAQNADLFPGLPTELLVLNPQRSGPFGEDGYLWFVDFDFVYMGVPIEGARLVFRCNHGAMVQFGMEGIVPFTDGAEAHLNPYPFLTAEQALDVAAGYAGGLESDIDTVLNPGTLKFVPRLKEPGVNAIGSRFEYPLVWEVAFTRSGVTGTWVAWVDAHDGQVLSFWDDNDYGVVKGGVYPVSQTISTEVKRGLPFANVASGVYANWAGKYTSPTSGSVTSTLAGKYVKIADSCGSISLAGTAPNDLDFGASSGTDCTTPGVGGAGNTHAARSCFYHIGNIKYKAMQWLPSNTWLQGQLTANMNLNQTCNAYWNGSTINFFRSGGGCGNTGEIASIFIHEFGHGLDSNDGGPSSDKATGEVYGDGLAMLQTHNSCGGPGFLSSNCDGYGDACTACTGVREADYAKHSSGQPHTTLGFVKNNCPSSSSYYGPCGKEGHCEAYPGIETMWDLANRDLGPLVGDTATGWFILDRLFFLSRATSGSMYTCSSYTASGCSASNWHQTFLVADDNDGNLTNGTPHAGAIKSAFTRHGLACSTSTSTNSTTCPSLLAPSPVDAVAGNNQVALTWPAVTNASKYYILRNDLGCDNGYTKIAETTTLGYTDSDVANGMTYYYRVVAVGSSAACFSNLSACKTATPTSGGATTYSISGTVSGATGVTVSLTGAATASTTTDGSYTFSGLANGSYTVTATKNGCTFSPANYAVTISGADQTGKNFTATCTSSDVALTSGTGYSDSVGLQAWKYYYIDVPSGATNLEIKTTNASADVDLYTQFNAKPTSSSYACRPYESDGNETCAHASPSAGRWYAGVYGYAAGSYTITATVTIGSVTYSISGTITNGGGATVNLTGTATKTATADASGNYTFTGLANGTYTVTPSKTGCTFSPASLAVTISGANQTGKNFTATCGSGETELTSGVGVSGSVAQEAYKIYYINVPSGASQLQFTLTNLSADIDLYTKYNATPSISVYDCKSENASTTNETCTHANPTAGVWKAAAYGYAAGNFTITATITLASGYTISGTVSGATASGVTMTLSGAGTGTTTTDASGNYSFTNRPNGTYTITPSKTGYTFSPSSLSVTVNGANQTGKNFTASASGGTCNAIAAAYNSTYKAPTCANGKSCDTGTLVNGRGTMTNKNETNRPNTINNQCTDGNSGTYGSDENIEQITVATSDGACLAKGKTITITAKVYCYSTSTDYLDMYYTTNVTTPSWTKITSTTRKCTATGWQNISVGYTIPSTAPTGNHGVRVNYRYNTATAPTTGCSTGSYDESDDVVFYVN